MIKSFIFILIYIITILLFFGSGTQGNVNSDWFADQWGERSILGHAQIHKGKMKGDDPEIDTTQTPKRMAITILTSGRLT